MCQRASGYLPQRHRRVVGQLERPPPWPRGLPEALTRSPAPASSPFAAGGHRERQLAACVLPTGGDGRTTAPSLGPKSVFRPHLLPDQRPFLLPGSTVLARPKQLWCTQPPCIPRPRTLFFFGGGGRIRGQPALQEAHLQIPERGEDQSGILVGHLRREVGRFLIALCAPRPHPTDWKKWRRHPLERGSRRGAVGLSAGEGSGLARS